MRKTIFDANRAMCYIAERDDQVSNIVTWSLATATSLYLFVPSQVNGIKYWVNKAFENSNKLEIGDQNIVDSIRLILDDKNTLSDLENEEIQSLLEELIRQVNHIVYSKQQPPENLWEDANIQTN